MSQTRTTRRRTRRGFTLIEAIVIIVILGVLAAVIAPRLLGRIGSSRTAVAQSAVSTLAGQMNLVAVDLGALDEGWDIEVLWEEPSGAEEGAWKGPYVNNRDELVDPWGNDYILVIPGDTNIDFDILSYGRDGSPGGADEDRDIVN